MDTQRSEQMVRSRTIAAARSAEIAARYEAGESSASIAEDVGLSVSAVMNAVRREGVQPRPKGKVAQSDAESIAADYLSGMTYKEVAAKYHVSWGTARKAVLASGGTSRRAGGFAHRKPSGPLSWNWTGGRVQTSYGYWQVWIPADDPLAAMRLKRGYVLEHRLVVARALGRPLLRSETVHHINGDKADNRLENLQLRQGHHGQGVRMCCGDCGSENLVTRTL